MKIAFTGGGTGGHFYPLIAIAESVQDLVREKQLLEPSLFFFAPAPFDEQALFANRITFVKTPAGKLRRYSSVLNFFSYFITLWGTVTTIFTLFKIYPDVVMSKGGYGSVPTVLAAALLRIPIIIHDSDAKPGRATLLAAHFADKIAISFARAASFFPPKVQSKIARTGIPIRKSLMRVETEGARQYLGLDPSVPTILILGGSQGAVRINDIVLSALADLVTAVNVIHQTGAANIKEVEAIASVALKGKPHAERYHPLGYLTEVALQRAAGAADLVVSRAGAGSIAEISVWQKPSLIIPIPESVSHDQRTNAYSYAGTGAAVVLEEENLTPHLLASEVRRLTTDKALLQEMGAKAATFTDTDAAQILASELLAIGLSHETV